MEGHRQKKSKSRKNSTFAFFLSMAFHNLVEALASTVHRDTITSPLVEHAITSFRGSLSLYRYRLPPSRVPLLNEIGIPCNTFSCNSHPHPIHKTIELHLLFEHWKPLARIPASVLYMKPEKFKRLQDANKNFELLINVRTTAKDVTRYPNSNPQYISTPLAFMHDSLMFFSPSQIVDLFANSPALEHLYASIVVPPESFLNLPSLYPDIYTYTTTGSNICYSLENNPSSSYVQPTSALEWLRIHTIRSPHFNLTITLLDSWLSVHSLLITRSSATDLSNPPPHRAFKSPNAILLPSTLDTNLPIKSRLVPKDVYDSLFIYVRAVRTLRVTDPAGYVRTQRLKPEFSWVHSSAWDALVFFSIQTCSARPNYSFGFFSTPWEKIKFYFHSLLEKYGYHLGTSFALIPLFRAISPFTFSFFTHIPCLPRCFINVPYFTVESSLFLKLFSYTTGSRFCSYPSYDSSFLNYLLQPFNRSILPTPLFTVKLTISPLTLGHRIWQLTRSRASLCFMACSLAFLAHKWLLSPMSIQAASDSYNSYFHPEPWRLLLPTYAVSCDGSPFYKVKTLPLPSPSIESSSPPSSPSPPPPTPPTSSHKANSITSGPLSLPLVPPAINIMPPPSTSKSPSSIHYLQMDLFDAPANSTLAHCISACVAMSLGIADSFRNRFPADPPRILSSRPSPGDAFLFTQPKYSHNRLHLVTKPTKTDLPHLDDISKSLEVASALLVSSGISQVYMPRIACGLDKQAWSNIEPLITKHLLSKSIDVYVCDLPNTFPPPPFLYLRLLV
nr:MAG: RNA-dependent RNA polymerase [Riboviria sp.]